MARPKKSAHAEEEVGGALERPKRNVASRYDRTMDDYREMVDEANRHWREYYKNEIEPRKGAFLAAYRKTFNIGMACNLVGISRQVVTTWREYDEDFKREFREAQQFCLDNLEGSLYQKALAGSETAAIMLLNASRAKKYRPQPQRGEDGERQVIIQFVAGPNPTGIPTRDETKVELAPPPPHPADKMINYWNEQAANSPRQQLLEAVNPGQAERKAAKRARRNAQGR